MIETFDKRETKQQAEDVLALIENLRPHPNARPISRQKLKLMATLADNKDLLELVEKATTDTLYWEMEDGEIIEQTVSLMEVPIA